LARVALFALAVGVALLSAPNSCSAASGLFPKMPWAETVTAVDCTKDSPEAVTTARALEGLINQTSAESYLISRPEDTEQLPMGGKPSTVLPGLPGHDAGLRTLFGQFAGKVHKMFVYDPHQDWTFYLAMMTAAQQGGIPVTDTIRAELTTEFKWAGPIEDYRNQWQNRSEAYDWALVHLMPGCSRQVIFVTTNNMRIIDYAVATKGFTFWLDFKNKSEVSEVEKIFSTDGYKLGTSLMGYANSGDDANILANQHGIGYVVSDYYGNGSFWSSYPNKVYHQAVGAPIAAQPGKIYVEFIWSDGDNIQFDQLKTFQLWHESLHGTLPAGTMVSPTLQELNPPLLDWYYAHLTPNDDLIAGPCGVQFIFGDSYQPDVFADWCALSRDWVKDAGLHISYMWHTKYPSDKYTTYAKGMNLTGIINKGGDHVLEVRYDLGTPIVDGGHDLHDEQELFDRLSKPVPSNDGPLFISCHCTLQPFLVGDGGYAKVQRVVDRLKATYPDRYIYLLPKDFFATIRSYYHLTP
jgi:hypothetical protein